MEVLTVAKIDGAMVNQTADDGIDGVDHRNSQQEKEGGHFGTGKNRKHRQKKSGQTFATVTGHNTLGEKIERQKTKIGAADSSRKNNYRPLSNISRIAKTNQTNKKSRDGSKSGQLTINPGSPANNVHTPNNPNNSNQIGNNPNAMIAPKIKIDFKKRKIKNTTSKRVGNVGDANTGTNDNKSS